MRFRKILASAAVVAAAGGGALAMAGSASASTTYTATTAMSNWPDGGHNITGGYWATEQFSRTAVLTDNGVNSGDSSLENYTLVITDSGGEFSTNSGVSDPAGVSASLIAHAPISGFMSGTITESFTEPKTITPNAGGVPTTDSDRSVPTSAWASLFFGGNAESNSVETYSYSYYSPQTCETWVDSSTDNDGQTEPAAGDITGWGQCEVSITNPGSQETHAGAPVSLQIQASTGSSDSALHYSMTGAPGGLTINSSTGLITGVPVTPENIDIARVNVTDAYGSSSHVYFGWDVTNAQVPDTISVSYVCGFGHPRGKYLVEVTTGTYNAHVNLQERLWGGALVGDGSVTVHPGTPIYVNANNGVALRIFYERNGTTPPSNEAGAVFAFARIPANPHSC